MGPSDISEVAVIRKALKHAWLPFFARFGKLTAVQLEAIPRILDGLSLAIASPTASGKTEAVVAPVAEMSVRDAWKGLSLLYVVPTRALGNDTYVRIHQPLEDMGLVTTLKHGDRPTFPKKLPNALITTPESLDSLICRSPRFLCCLRAVVLDEIHLVDGNYRGDQLRVLLARLRKISRVGGFGTYLLSATLRNASETASRYAQDVFCVSIPGVREIDGHIVHSHEEVWSLAQRMKWKKLLCFANRRETVEAAAADMGRICHPYQVVAHHGSLSRSTREEAEMFMRECNIGVCVATSTLEIGIDIGDIDLIVLLEIPWSLSSLLQRIGRGNRRDNIAHVAAMVSSEDQETIALSMFRAASKGEIESKKYRADPSVALQQTLSLLFQNPGGLSREDVLEVIVALCPEHEWEAIVESLMQKGWVERRGRMLFGTTKLMDFGERGLIHSNIPDGHAYRVVDSASGREIGRIAGAFDEVFVLGRRCWKVVSSSQNTVIVQGSSGKGTPARFRRHRNLGAFAYLLPEDILKQAYGHEAAHEIG